jgi:hypothetical protein
VGTRALNVFEERLLRAMRMFAGFEDIQSRYVTAWSWASARVLDFDLSAYGSRRSMEASVQWLFLFPTPTVL